MNISKNEIVKAVKAAGAVVGFIGLCWVTEYVVIPAILWTVLALFGQAPA